MTSVVADCHHKLGSFALAFSTWISWPFFFFNAVLTLSWWRHRSSEPRHNILGTSAIRHGPVQIPFCIVLALDSAGGLLVSEQLWSTSRPAALFNDLTPRSFVLDLSFGSYVLNLRSAALFFAAFPFSAFYLQPCAVRFVKRVHRGSAVVFAEKSPSRHTRSSSTFCQLW